MLVDLDWTNPDPSKFVDWDTSQGLSLVTAYEHERFPWRVALRIHKGIYIAYGLDNSIPQFTDYEVIHPWEESRAIWEELKKASPEEKEGLRKKLLRLGADYGRADNLKQILKRGRRFVRSPEPYVLEVHYYKNDHDKNYKAGPYIGDKIDPDEVVAFSWIRLRSK